MIIFNLCKDTLDGFIESLDLEFLDKAGVIIERFRNTPKFESSLANLLEEDSLDKDVSNSSSWLVPQIENFVVRCHVILS